MLHRAQKVNGLLGCICSDQLLIKVRLDSFVQLKVNEVLLAWQLDAHHHFAAFHEAKFADLWRFGFFKVC